MPAQVNKLVASSADAARVEANNFRKERPWCCLALSLFCASSRRPVPRRVPALSVGKYLISFALSWTVPVCRLAGVSGNALG